MMRLSFLFTALLNIMLFSYGDAALAFSLLSPADGEKTLCSVILDWEDVSDPNLRLTYTLFLSKDDADFNYPIRIEYLDYSIRLITSDDGIEDASHYYWKVWAVNEYGEIQKSDVRQFYTDNVLN
jgi:hypothetical protein